MTARTAHDLDALSFADRALLPVPTMISPRLDVERHTPLTIASRCGQRHSTGPLGLADKRLNDSPAEADGRVAKIGRLLEERSESISGKFTGNILALSGLRRLLLLFAPLAAIHDRGR
jgi:hypothetical protein